MGYRQLGRDPCRFWQKVNPKKDTKMNLDEHLKIKRCPHCGIDNPNLASIVPEFVTSSDDGKDQRQWRIYKCSRCGGVVAAWCHPYDRKVLGYFPKEENIDESLPAKVQNYLQQAVDSTFAPSGAIMLCANAVNAMLREKKIEGSSLQEKIGKAVEQGLINKEMETWAGKIRLDTPEQDDDNLPMPSVEQAKQSIAFSKALADFLFVLPEKIQKGIAASSKKK